MFRTEKTVGMLKTIALIASFAIILWSIGLPSARLAAANLTTLSDTISDSAPDAQANHNIEFVTASGVANSEDIVVTFPAGFDLAGIGQEDIQLLIDDADKIQSEWSVATTATDITITIDTGFIGAGSSTQILIGLNASGTPNSQIDNPSAEGSYEIDIVAGSTPDTGTTHVVIMASVTVSASVDTVFTFAVDGVGSGVSVNGDTTTGTTSSTSIPFGTLSNGVATTSAQQLTVTTNATNGYVVTIQLDGALESETGADIDGFNNGGDTDTPETWALPSPDIEDENTWGHWGFTSDDATTTRAALDEFDANEWAAASTAPRVVMSHDGPVGASGVGVGTTTVGYKIAITSLQEAADDYSAILTYVATPTF
jgi:hypothetical protein